MSKKSTKPAGPVTRRQQVAAICQVKGEEIAMAVGEKVRSVVKDEVERQLKTITATMLDCVDRVLDLETKATREHGHLTKLFDRVVDLEARQHAVPMKRAKNETVEAESTYCVECGSRAVRYKDDEGSVKGLWICIRCEYIWKDKSTDERDSDDRQSGAEAVPVQQDDQVVPDPFGERLISYSADPKEGPQGG